MLRLPTAGEDPGPLIVYPSPTLAAEQAEDHEESEHDHDHDHAEEKEGSTLRFIAMMSVPGVLLLGLFAWMLMPKDQSPAATNTPVAANETAPAQPLDEAKPEATSKRNTKPSQTVWVQLEDVVQKFLTAPTAEEALKWIYRPDEVKAKAEAWYVATPYESPGFKGVGSEFSYLSEEGTEAIGLFVRKGDFQRREIALVETPEGYRVDWESWAGWSEMNWSDFKKQRPTEPKLFRVVSSPSGYYNFSFKNETEWISFRLESPDGEDFLYGYAPTASDLAARLRPTDGVDKRHVILKLKFPADSPVDNQVLIEEIVNDRWLDLPGKR